MGDTNVDLLTGFLPWLAKKYLERDSAGTMRQVAGPAIPNTMTLERAKSEGNEVRREKKARVAKQAQGASAADSQRFAQQMTTYQPPAYGQRDPMEPVAGMKRSPDPNADPFAKPRKFKEIDIPSTEERKKSNIKKNRSSIATKGLRENQIRDFSKKATMRSKNRNEE